LFDLFIKPGYRKRGIGRMLMQRLAEIAEERKCARIELDVEAKNKEAFAFYNKFGFKPGRRVKIERQVK
jgi:ribosomal protein S18 acetylase RimI-like enzyme